MQGYVTIHIILNTMRKQTRWRKDSFYDKYKFKEIRSDVTV